MTAGNVGVVGALGRIDKDAFEVDGVTFRIDYTHDSTDGVLCIRKPAELVEAYERLVERCTPKTIIELGIGGGGSTALLALLAAPQKLVALELGAEPVTGLTDFIERRGLSDSVRPYYGIDQADREAVTTILDHEFSAGEIDLVIDDASHLLRESRASFEMLFPRLRPGGLYVLEDWASHDRVAIWAATAAAKDEADPSPVPRPLLERAKQNLKLDEAGRDEPVSRLLLEFILARMGLDDIVDEITVDRHLVVVRRGPGDLDPQSFQLSDLYADHYHVLG